VGDENIIREYVTIHKSMYEGEATVIGKGNFIMAGVHIAHDCKIGDNVTITNYAGLTGHVMVEDGAFISGLVAIHQFVRIGAFSMVGGGSKVVQDVPPYLVVDGHPARVYGVNVTGLKRAGFDIESRTLIKRAYHILYKEGLNTRQAIEQIKRRLPQNGVVKHLVEFVENSKRGICRGR
jgi:UDP-N-acetylglucosamine acyltransferase